MPLKPNDVIANDKHRILKLIGEGGMARVWLAEELTIRSILQFAVIGTTHIMCSWQEKAP